MNMTWILSFKRLTYLSFTKLANLLATDFENSVQLSLSGAQLCDPMDCSMPGFPCPSSTPRACSNLFIKSVMPSNHLILCCLLLLLPSIFPSIRVFSNESVLHIRWPKDWSFIFHIHEYSGLISFRMDWLDLLAVQGTQESSPSPQFKSINSLVLSFLYGPILTSIHDYWKNHSFG